MTDTEKSIDAFVNGLREELGFSERCEDCERNTRQCQYETCYTNMDFCERFDYAVDTIKARMKEENK